MESHTFQLTCPICGRTDIGSYQNHLQTHSKQALIDMLINQHQVITPAYVPKPALEPEFVAVDPQTCSPAEDGDDHHTHAHTAGGSTRRIGILRHGTRGRCSQSSHHSRRISQNPLETDGTEILNSAANILEQEQPLRSSSSAECTSGSGSETLIYGLEVGPQGEPQVSLTPIRSLAINLPSSEKTGGRRENEVARKVEQQDQVDELTVIPFDENQVLELVSESGGDATDGTLYIDECDQHGHGHGHGHDKRELETAATLALRMSQIPRSNGITNSNFIKYIVDESGTRAVVGADPGVKWIFADEVADPVYSSFHQVAAAGSSSRSQSQASFPARIDVTSPAEEDSSLSNSKGHSSSNGRRSRNRGYRGNDVNLMTDEEIPPHGEISEYEESNTSSLLSEDSKPGLISSSLGSMFSDRVRRFSPVIDQESLSSQSKAKKRRAKTLKSNSVTITSAFPPSSPTNEYKCNDCVPEQYFGSMLELGMHQSDVHQKRDGNISIRQELDANLDWMSSCRSATNIPDPLSITERDPVKIKQEARRGYKQKEFSCLYCVYSAVDKKSLDKHVGEEHTGKLLDPSQFECTTCGKMFYARINLVKHLLIHRGKRHACSRCSKAFTSQFKLKEHFRVHTKDYPFPCTQCERSFRTPSLRTAHIRRVHEGIKVEKPTLEFYCGICHRVLHSKAGLLTHAQTHNETAAKCHFCQESFPKRSILVRHIRVNHDPKYESKESKACPKCFKLLHPNSMKSHMRIHNGEKPFPCPVCAMTFRTYANLSSHSWSHTNADKPFKCKKCPKSYLFKKYLDSHMIVHKRRTSHFTCNECGVKFTSKMNMKRHIEEHFKEKKYKCKTCGKCFHRKYYLSEHERIHSNLKPFSCSICGKTSTTKSNHRSHIKIHDARETGTLEG